MNRKTARENAFILVFEKNFRDEPLTSIIEDAIEADTTFDMLMGEKVEPRKEFILTNAKFVKNLDI